MGEDLNAPRKNSVKLNQRIYNIVSKFEERTEGEHFLDYLEGLAQNFTYEAILTLKKMFLFILFLGKTLSVNVGECR